MIPPLIIDMAIGKNDGKIFRLWFPVIVLWPFLFVLSLIILPLAVVAQIVLAGKGIRPLSILLAFVNMLSALRGLEVNVKPGNGTNWSKVKIKIS